MVLPAVTIQPKDTITITITITNTNTNTITNTITYTNLVQQEYKIDSPKILRIGDLVFKDSYSSIEISKDYYNCLSLSSEGHFKLICQTLVTLDSSTNKGFLTGYDLTTYPIISELLTSFITEDGKEYVNGIESMESYKWIYNIVILNLYVYTLEILSRCIDNDNLENEMLDKSRELYGRLDPSIRHHLQRRGISIKEMFYIGFDTEFSKKDEVTNNLVSAQLAITTRTFVQIPKKVEYTISVVDGTSNKITKLRKDSSRLNYKKIEASIQSGIEGVRKIKYKQNDGSMFILSEGLRMIKGLNYCEKDDYTVFALPRSVIQPYIQFCDSFSMKEILGISGSISKPYIEQSNKILMELIKSITPDKFNLIEGKDKLLEDLHKVYGEYREIEQIGVDFDKPLDVLPQFTPNNSTEQRLTREFMMDEYREKLSITKMKTYYILAHLTQADLSMLTDFEVIKEELNIVNGSFVTLGKPINYLNKNVHVRDTMLLAPGPSKALASIGSLYGVGLNKIQITKSDLEDMQGFLKRDEAKFTEYAIRDAVISLIHSC